LKYDDNAPNWRSGNLYHEKEIAYVRDWLSRISKPVFLDIGAHTGLFCLGVQDLCAKIYAWEPQRIVFNLLAGTVAINSLEHIWLYGCALGACNGLIPIPTFDYRKSTNFGGVEFGGRQKYGIGQEPGTWNGETTPLRTLDSFNFVRVDVVKIDVEGMEMDVLKGAVETIQKHRPKILIEHGKTKREEIQDWFKAQGYSCKDIGQGSDLACEHD
jgi:FkbM family methyltransferase